MKLSIVKGATSQIVDIFIQDSTSTTGAGKTGLVYNTSSLVCYRARSDDGNAGGTAITLATATKGTWATGGFVEKDATNMPGLYEFHIPNNALATGSRFVVIMFKGATGMAPLVLEVELTGTDNQDAVHGGLSALPAATAGASGGLLISGSNSGTTTLGALTVTGTLTVSDGIAVTRSSGNSTAFSVTGSGTGHGFLATSGNGATGDAVRCISASTTGQGLNVAGTGAGAGFQISAGATGHGVSVSGGGTSGNGFDIAATSGHGIKVNGGGTTKHGIFATGGATTSAGIAAAGGGTSGDGILVTATSGHGINTAGTGTTKHGINAAGGATTSHGINAIGGGAGHGILATSGSGSTGDGIRAIASSTTGNGLNVAGNGAGLGFQISGGATGHGMGISGGGTSGNGLDIGVTSGHAVNAVAGGTAKDALHLVGAAAVSTNAAGHGVNVIGGASTTSAGGTAGRGFNALGGAGSASTNGAGAGFVSTGGGTTTVSGAAGVSYVHSGSAKDLDATTTNLVISAVLGAGVINNAAFDADVGSTAIATNVIGIASKKGTVAALNVDTYAEPGQEAPAATNTLVAKIGYIFKFLRNKKTQTASTLSILSASDDTTVDQKATLSDDGTTFTHGKIVSGP